MQIQFSMVSLGLSSGGETRRKLVGRTIAPSAVICLEDMTGTHPFPPALFNLNSPPNAPPTQLFILQLLAAYLVV